VDLNKIVARAKAMVLTPRTEWPVAAAEPATVSSLFTGYIVVLAAVPAIAMLLKLSVLGTSAGFFGTFRMPLTFGLSQAILSYVLSLVGVYVSAYVVNALAPSFGGQKDQVQALKAVAYSYTAYWAASIALILPWLGFLIVFIAGLYSIYLLNMGLPYTMKCPPEKSVGYTVVTIIVTIVIYFVIGAVLATAQRMTGVSPFGAAFTGNAAPAFRSSDGGFEPGSTGAKVEAWSNSVDKATKQLDAANKSGDTNAQANAMGAVLGAALGGGGKVESLPGERLKPFLPDKLGGLSRTQLNVQRNGALGMQVSTGTATYSDGAQHTLELEITDTGSLKGLVGFAAGYTGSEQDTETDTGYDKLYKSGDQLIHEKWDNRNQSGEYGTVVADRFAVKVSGTAGSVDELKSALAGVDLAGLAALRNDGVQSN
jgi:Yip1 domain